MQIFFSSTRVERGQLLVLLFMIAKFPLE